MNIIMTILLIVSIVAWVYFTYEITKTIGIKLKEKFKKRKGDDKT